MRDRAPILVLTLARAAAGVSERIRALRRSAWTRSSGCCQQVPAHLTQPWGEVFYSSSFVPPLRHHFFPAESTNETFVIIF